MMVETSSVLAPAKGLRTRVIDDETVILSQQSGEILVLDALGSRIFELVDGNTTVDGIAERLLEEYEVEKPQLESDLDSFLRELLDAGILEDVSSGP